jgi:hypothetical protein
MADRAVRAALFVSPLMHCAEKVVIDSVQVDVLAEIQVFAPEAERDEIVEERLRGDFGEILAVKFLWEAVVSSACQLAILCSPTLPQVVLQ